jgi:hypothetical protein
VVACLGSKGRQQQDLAIIGTQAHRLVGDVLRAQPA